jgi:hypothetical protein
MQRINTANVVADLFGAGKNGFGAGDPATNKAATFLNADWCNMVQEELATIVESVEALDPAKRYQVLGVLKKLFLSNEQIIDRTGQTATLLLDRFDVIHRYRMDRAIGGNGNFPEILASTGMVQGGVYKVWCTAASSAAFRDTIVTIRPNGASYSNQFSTSYIATQITSAGRGTPVATDSTLTSNLRFDNYEGNVGGDPSFEMTIYPMTASAFKRVFYQGGDTGGVCIGQGTWENTSNAWQTVGAFNIFYEQVDNSAPYNIELNVRRIL